MNYFRKSILVILATLAISCPFIASGRIMPEFPEHDWTINISGNRYGVVGYGFDVMLYQETGIEVKPGSFVNGTVSRIEYWFGKRSRMTYLRFDYERVIFEMLAWTIFAIFLMRIIYKRRKRNHAKHVINPTGYTRGS